MTHYLDENRFENQVLSMLYYDRTGISEGTDIAKCNKSRECMIYHYWF